MLEASCPPQTPSDFESINTDRPRGSFLLFQPVKPVWLGTFRELGQLI